MEAASSTRVSRAQMNTILRALCSDFLRESAEVLQEELSWKKEWTRKWILRRKSSGASSQLLSELRVEDPREYRSLLRMSPATFDEQLHRLTPIITKQDTVMREALSPKIKLEVTLAFLATGASTAKRLNFCLRFWNAKIVQIHFLGNFF
ncbi:hypothetical protein GE061_013226 [Apolygus lucorum]|uniref:Uncharacterized protein n=1 Tax=Apolygus lucorum TaxID=248454 RepID=A0A6A4JYG7_APOLU|nr:hypothetical protein GE061_013226 [Apolygus lucorum]